MRTFEEIASAIRHDCGDYRRPGHQRGGGARLYDDYIQQLPAVEAIDAFLPSHQMAVAQLALTSCSELVENNAGAFFTGRPTSQIRLRLSTSPTARITTAGRYAGERAQIIDPVLTAAMNVDQGLPANNLTTQPGRNRDCRYCSAAVSTCLDARTLDNGDLGRIRQR